MSFGINGYVSETGESNPNELLFNYNTNTFCNYTFPASENLVSYSTKYGVGGYANTTYDFGSTDFIEFINNSSQNQQAFVAPFDMVLSANNSYGGFSGSWQGYGLRFVLGYYVPTYTLSSPYIIMNTPTVVLDKTYMPNGATVDMFEDINSEIIIPKGAVCLYTYAFMRPSSISHKIRTQLMFKKI